MVLTDGSFVALMVGKINGSRSDSLKKYIFGLGLTRTHTHELSLQANSLGLADDFVKLTHANSLTKIFLKQPHSSSPTFSTNGLTQTQTPKNIFKADSLRLGITKV